MLNVTHNTKDGILFKEKNNNIKNDHDSDSTYNENVEVNVYGYMIEMYMGI